MLELEQGWRRYTGGWVAMRLLEQISDEGSKTNFSRHLIRAALDLAVATFFGRNGRIVTVTEPSPGLWCLLGLRYLFLPVVDNDALDKCEEVLRKHVQGVVIVPPNYDFLLREALEHRRPRTAPQVQGLDGFISWRTMFAELDGRWRTERVMRFLFNRYNVHAAEAGTNGSMMIHVPRDTKDLPPATPQ